MAKQSRDLYADITESIITLIESGKKDGSKLWDNASGALAFRPVNAITNKPYNGINRLHLAIIAGVNDYQENKWATYNQAKTEGWQVRKGEKSITLCYYNSYTKENKETGEDEQKFFLKSFNVFNVSQLDGYTPTVSDTPVVTTAENCESIKTILAKTDVKFLSEKGDMAFYSPSRDAIQMPPKACFTSENAYYSVIAHELCHSVGHKSRLDRFEAYRNAYKTEKEQYAREELVAELGAAFLGAELGFVQENLEFHASYLDHWLSIIKEDKKALFKAAADAQKATDFIMNNWVKEQAEEAETIAV
jgi:antirestriction protein ArdC